MAYPAEGWTTVAEMPEFSRRARRLLSERDQEGLIRALAANPLAGVVLQGTGGIRKLRWSREGRGKSGGVRVIYYVHGDAAPVYLLTIYGKGERADLSSADRSDFAAMVEILKKQVRRGT